MENYILFLKELDSKLKTYFKTHSSYICCKKRCSFCCENGDYPVSELELKYIMQGYTKLNEDTKIRVQQNFIRIQRGGQCPFLINKECSIYQYRPIICRVHGLAYLCHKNTVKVPYCTNIGLNYSKVYQDETFNGDPIPENLDSQNLLKDFEFGEIRNLYDWLNKDS